ncbi:PAS domain S-box protein [Mesobacillus maritimus]|uniref:PAS domain S-box protein n=1 Tax=Mesobacillus maritimus TaxID=1643336 RepID=A0ABS7K844_9BACI|nr:PAS domain S-box protein [Mesobacillus maritimus]MBY0098414.1 PAS domain S-box protein [Mesobacillus maritimus]
MLNFINRFEQAFFYSPIGMALVSLEGNWLKVNPALTKITGYTEKEFLSMTFQDITYPDDLEADISQVEQLVKGKKDFYEMEKRYLHKSGNLVWALLSVSIVREGDKSLYLIAQIQDITESIRLKLHLTESEERYRRLVEHSPLGILVHQKGMIQYANSTAIELLGFQETKDLLGVHIHSFVHFDDRRLVSRRIESIEKHNQIAPSIYIKLIRFDGQEIDAEVIGLPIQLNGHSAVQVVFRDVTERKKEEDLIRYRAYHDTLTDLPNRLKFQIDLEEEINKDTTFTIMYLDLHGLKTVNDSYGHQAGDVALIKVTARLSGVLGSNGLVYRLGGDEFAIVLPGHKNDQEIAEIANNIAEVIKQPIYVANTIVQITTSIGVVFYPDHGVEMDLLLRHADIAMYHAKKINTVFKIYDQ